MIKLGLIKDKGVWNTPYVNLDGKGYKGYKPEKSEGIWGLVTKEDNFLLVLEDDDFYNLKFTMNQEELNELILIVKNFRNINVISTNFDIIITEERVHINFKKEGKKYNFTHILWKH